jgi:hypothetical protein
MRFPFFSVALPLIAYLAMGVGYGALSLMVEYVSWVGAPQTLAMWTPLMAFTFVLALAAFHYEVATKAAAGCYLVMPWLAYAYSHVGEIGALLYYAPAALTAALILVSVPASRARKTVTPQFLRVSTRDGLTTSVDPDGTILVNLPGGPLHRQIVDALGAAFATKQGVEVLDDATGHVLTFRWDDEEAVTRPFSTGVSLWLSSPDSRLVLALLMSAREAQPSPVQLRFRSAT